MSTARTTTWWMLACRIILWAAVAASVAYYVHESATTVMYDLDVYIEGARAALGGGDLYGDRFGPIGLPFLYTPISAVLFMPFTVVSTTSAQVVWGIVTLASALGLAALAVRHYSSWSDTQRWAIPIVTLGVLWSDPFNTGFGFGQINVLLALLVVADLTRSTGRLPQGVLIGVAAAIKLTPLFLIAYFVVTRRYRAAAWSSATFVGVGLMGFLVLPAQSATYWSGLFLDADRVNGSYLSNQSFTAVVLRVVEREGDGGLLVLALTGLLAVAALAWAHYAYPRLPRATDAVLLVIILLVSPLAWTHHWITALPLVLVAVTWPISSGPKAVGWAVRCSGILFAAVLVTGWVWRAPHDDDREFGWTVSQSLVGNSYVLVASLVVALIVVGSFCRPARSPDQSETGTTGTGQPGAVETVAAPPR